MIREDSFHRIVDALHVKYGTASLREVVSPSELQATLEPRNILLLVNKGAFYAGKDFHPLKPGACYFMPAGTPIYFRHGDTQRYTVFGRDGFGSSEHRAGFVKLLPAHADLNVLSDVFTIVAFDVQVYGAIPFFATLELPCMEIPADEKLQMLLKCMVQEEEEKAIGKERQLSNLCDQLVVQICRHIIAHKDYGTAFEKVSFLLDKRLVSIIQYVQNNLNGDLSNQAIAQLAYVSKDYVGQFFKSMTNANLQDYIEQQRLEKAHQLLRSSTESIQEIAQAIGFKDPAYFSRRFKLKFGKNANQIRRDSSIGL